MLFPLWASLVRMAHSAVMHDINKCIFSQYIHTYIQSGHPTASFLAHLATYLVARCKGSQIFCSLCKGQLISKTIYGLLTSPKKRNGRVCFVCFFTLHGKKIKFVCLFFGRLDGSPISFSISSDL